MQPESEAYGFLFPGYLLAYKLACPITHPECSNAKKPNKGLNPHYSPRMQYAKNLQGAQFYCSPTPQCPKATKGHIHVIYF